MLKLQFILSSCTLVLSLAYAIAVVEVINFPVGESLHSVPNAVLLKQLQVRDASPASGTVSIGEITAKWETDATNDWISVIRNSEGEISSTDTYQWSDEGGWYIEGEEPSGAPDIYFWNGSWHFGEGQYEAGEDVLSVVFEDSPPGYSTEYFRESLSHKVPHATTNALWTVTAAGGSAVTNFPANSYEYLKPGIDWVRYGTATGGFVRLFVED